MDRLPAAGNRPRHTPSCRRVIVVGAGGFGREVWQWARDAWSAADVELVGFLDTQPEKPALPAVIVGDPARHEPAPGEGFLLAIGIPRVRRRVAEMLAARGARFVSLIHPTATVADTAQIGEGTIVCPHAVLSDASRTGACVIVNYHASIAHDASAGDFAVLSPYAALAGDSHVGADAFLGMHATVGPGRRLGERCKVTANSCALTDVPPDSIVYGVPGRVGPILD